MGTNQRAEIAMTPDEVSAFVAQRRTATMATNGPSGVPHLVAMWYGVVDGAVCFETKAKSQKVANLRRDRRIACMIEAGQTYDELRGVSIEGMARIVDDPDDPLYWATAVSVFERYQGPYSDEMRPFVEAMMHKRVVVRIEAERVRSWDHRKLGGGAMPLAGTTAEFL